jgi:hypothetical protein
MNAVQRYLRLVNSYCEYFGGLRWSSRDNAVVYADGRPFVFNGQVALFLEGFAAGGSLINFNLILHLLDLLEGQGKSYTPEIVWLRAGYAKAGRPLRNAGAFFAHLCSDIPRILEPVEVRTICERLRDTTMPVRWFLAGYYSTYLPAEHPPLGPVEFEEKIITALRPLTEEELLSWLRHGRGTVADAGEKMAQQLPGPRTLAGRLAALTERPRLAGARHFVAQLGGALTLPPRRLAQHELPVGGYADVTTRGHPDRILPSQFALDSWDFFRRYAENELLYFRREEPHAQTRQELIVVLDQGVRTWGDVRLVLGAAVMALGKQAARRKLPFLLATTGTQDLMDPMQTEMNRLGEVVEASDLTPNPGLTLERVLERPASDHGRDVVLLTHPRSLAEDDLAAAARRVGPTDRLFAVTLDDHGAGALTELRHGVPLTLRTFRVDLGRIEPAPAETDGEAPQGPSGWSGDVEPVGFPFSFGVAGPIKPFLFDFDYAGRWLLTVSGNGLLHLWGTDGGNPEVLPRGMLQGQVLTAVTAVLGVAGGFVVAGGCGVQQVGFHYDFDKRTCTAYPVPDPRADWFDWYYSPAHHTVIARAERDDAGHAIHLSTGRRYSNRPEAGDPLAKEAYTAWENFQIPEKYLGVAAGPSTDSIRWPFCYLDSSTGQVQVKGPNPPWPPFTPLANGRPALKGHRLVEAKRRCRTLTLKTSGPGDRPDCTLRLFDGPTGTPLEELPLKKPHFSFALSADGTRLAWQVGDARLEIRQATGVPGVLATTWPESFPVYGVEVIGQQRTWAGRFAQQLRFLRGPRWLLLFPRGRRTQFLDWSTGKLEVRTTLPPDLDESQAERAAREALPDFAQYDRQRFTLAATRANPIIVADRYGHMIVFDGRANRLVCMFFAFRDKLAGWMPDGTQFGPADLIRGPATPGAMEKLGQALLQASKSL